MVRLIDGKQASMTIYSRILSKIVPVNPLPVLTYGESKDLLKATTSVAFLNQ